VLTVSAAVKNAAVVDAIRARFGGRASWGYVRFLGDRADNYIRNLRVWPNTDHLLLGSSAVTRLFALGLVVLAALGWLTAALRSPAVAQRHRPRFGPNAWAVLVVLALLVLKSVVDLVVAPFWASAWYSAPERLAAGFVVGAGAWLGLQWLFTRAPLLAYGALAAIVLIAVPVNATDWKDDAHRRPELTWQGQIDLASSWTIRNGPNGRYGARDAGLLGHRLDRTRTVVNLDGLVNDYAFADLVIDNASLRRRIAATKVDYFVGRLTRKERDEELACAKTLWRSPGTIPFTDFVHGYSSGLLYVLDVRGCRST
jgi:hypothetical protein